MAVTTPFKWNEINDAMQPLVPMRQPNPSSAAWYSSDPTLPTEAPAAPKDEAGPWVNPKQDTYRNELGASVPLPKISEPPAPSPVWNTVDPNVAKRNQADQLELERIQKPDTFSSHKGFMGKLGHALSRVGNIAGDIAIPGVMQNVPNTDIWKENRAAYLNNQIDSQNAADADRQLKKAQVIRDQQLFNAQPQKDEDEHRKTNAEIDNYEAESYARTHPQAKYTVHDTVQGPMVVNEATGVGQHLNADGMPIGPKIQTEVVQLQLKGKPHQVLTNKETGDIIRDIGESGVKPQNVNINQGTWGLEESPDGTPLLLNNKTGDVRNAPAGIQKPGTFAKQQAALQPAKDALDYAQNYMQQGAFTGSGDEALMEKFFELAKPSSGFRMSQPQIDMLKNAQSWFHSMSATARHATSGTWFSDEQRKEIVDTMQQLANSKLGGAPSGNTRQSPQTGTHTFSLKAWKAANPDGDIEAARKAAKAQGYEVVD